MPMERTKIKRKKWHGLWKAVAIVATLVALVALRGWLECEGVIER